MESHTQHIPFLDCTIIKNGTDIKTDVFYKPTDSKAYLLFSSCHPKHTKISIPFSLARRLRTIISDPKTLHLRMLELEEFLKKQNYPSSLIKGGIDKANKLDRQKLLTNNDKESSATKTIALINTHNPKNPRIFKHILHDLNILKRDTTMNEVLEDCSIINSKRQPPNLKKTPHKG